MILQVDRTKTTPVKSNIAGWKMTFSYRKLIDKWWIFHGYVPIHPPRYGRFKVTATTGHVYSLDFSQAQGEKG